MTFRTQISQHSVAIISLIVALSALGYNTWRNEQTEHNRNIRQSGFEILVHIGELQRITYLAHYDNDQRAGSPRKGWVEVLVLHDLAELMPESCRTHADRLHAAWTEHWAGLGSEDESVAAIDAAIDGLRVDVVRILDSLD